MSTTAFNRPAELLQIAKIALPIIGAQLLQVSMGVIDTVMAGRIDALSIAAIALGSSIWFFVMLIGFGILLALTPILSQHIGSQNKRLVREEFRQGLWLALALGFITILMLVTVGSALSLMGIKPEIIPPAHDYLVWIAWSLPFTMLYLVPRSVSEAMANTMPLLWIQLIALPLNILGNYLLMYGNHGFPEMGASGAALSTGIAQAVSCVAIFIYTYKEPKYLDFDLFKRMTPPNWGHIYQTFLVGWPIAITMAMEVGLFSATALVMGRFGVDATAGHQIALNLASLTFMIPLGCGMALTVRIGQSVGANQIMNAKKQGQLGIQLCTAITIVSALFLWLFGKQLAELYTDDTAVITIAAQLLTLAAIFQIVDGLQIGAMGSLRGFKDTKIPMLLAIFSYWGVGMGTAVWLGIYQNMGPEGLWWGLVTGLACAAITLNYRFYLVTRSAKNENTAHSTKLTELA